MQRLLLPYPQDRLADLVIERADERVPFALCTRAPRGRQDDQEGPCHSPVDQIHAIREPTSI